MPPRTPPPIPFLKHSGVILAGAGSGKTSTTVALHASAKSIGKSAIVITFTNATVADYIRRANDEVPGLASTQSVFTFHKLAAYVLRDASERGAASLDTVVALAVEHVRSKGIPPDLMYTDVVLVDESQDCSLENYQLACEVAQTAKATVVMIGDANQCLYRFRNASERFLNTHCAKSNGFEHTLATNWRSSPQIVALSREFMRHPMPVKPNPRAHDGPLPVLMARDPRFAASEVIDIATRSLSNKHSVLVVGRSKRPRFENGVMVRMGLQLFVNDMERRHIPFGRMFRESAADTAGGGATSMVQRSRVNLATIHGSKGLEADVVVLVDAVDERIGGAPNPDQLELMYVAVTRARTQLFIVNSRFARCDPALERSARMGLCVHSGTPSLTPMPVTREPRGRYTVTQVLSDRTLISETDLLELSRMLAIDVQVFRRSEVAQDEAEVLPDAGDLSMLYGHLAENCVQMVYANNDSDPPSTYVIDRLAEYTRMRISVPAEFSRALSTLFALTGARRSDSISRSDVVALRNRLASRKEAYVQTIGLLDHIEHAMDRNKFEAAIMVPASSTQSTHLDDARKVLSAYTQSSTHLERLPHLFGACLFFYQLDHHAGYRWGRDYDRHITAFIPYFNRICGMSASLPERACFEKEIVFKHLRVSGRIDVAAPGRFIELKFCKQLGLTNFMQPCLYAIMDGDKFPRRCEVWNLASGEKVFVKFNNSTSNRWRVFQFLAARLDRVVALSDVEVKQIAGSVYEVSSQALRASIRVEGREGVAAAVQFTNVSVHDLV